MEGTRRWPETRPAPYLEDEGSNPLNAREAYQLAHDMQEEGRTRRDSSLVDSARSETEATHIHEPKDGLVEIGSALARAEQRPQIRRLHQEIHQRVHLWAQLGTRSESKSIPC